MIQHWINVLLCAHRLLSDVLIIDLGLVVVTGNLELLGRGVFYIFNIKTTLREGLGTISEFFKIVTGTVARLLDCCQ